MLSGDGKTGCNVSFDDFPSDLKHAHVKRRNTLKTVDPEEDEKEHDHSSE